MKKRVLVGLSCLLLGATPAWAANLVSVSNETDTVEYATLPEALSVCTGGETLTLLDNAALGDSLTISVPITIDLNGHSLGCTKNDANFLRAGIGTSGFTLKNGSLYTTGTCACIVPTAGTTVVASNVTFTGFGVSWSATGGNVTLNDCLVRTEYAASSDSVGCTMTLEGGTVLAPTMNIYNRGIQGTTLVLRSARTTFSPNAICEAFGGMCVYEPKTVHGIACRYHILTNAAAAAFPAAYVISADGVTTNGYDTINNAISASLNGETVSMIKPCTISARLDFNSSIRLELNGLNLRYTGGDFLRPAAGVTVDINGGSGTIAITQPGSIFCVPYGGCLNVSNCVVNGYCAVYGAAPGTVNFYDGVNVRSCTALASGGGSAALNVYGGSYTFNNWYVNYSSPNAGTVIRFYGGYLDAHHNPAAAPNQVLGEGCRAFYSDRFSEFPHEVVSPDVSANWSIEASNAGVFYTNIVTALRVAWNGSTVKILKDIPHIVSATTLGSRTSFLLDLQGHTISYAQMYNNPFISPSFTDLTLSNGVVQVGGTYACCFSMMPNSTLRAVAGARLLGAVNNTGGFYVSQTNAHVVLDGALLQTTYLASWASSGTHSSITVRGDGTNILSGILFPGTSIPSSSSFTVCGGWWNLDPSSYVPADHIKLHHPGKTPCAWRVKSWADICAKGWTFDPAADGAPTVQGSCAAIPAEPIVVSLVGDLPRKKTALVDLRNLQFTAGTLTVDSFVADPAWPKTCHLELEDGILKVQDRIGTTFIVR